MPQKFQLVEEKQSTDDAEMTSILELPDKDFKAAIIKILEQAIRNNLATNIKTENRRYKKNKWKFCISN